MSWLLQISESAAKKIYVAVTYDTAAMTVTNIPDYLHSFFAYDLRVVNVFYLLTKGPRNNKNIQQMRLDII